MNNNINDINVAWPKIKRSSKIIYDRGGFYNQPRLRIQKDGWIITATIISSINSKLITTDYTSIRAVYIPCVPYKLSIDSAGMFTYNSGEDDLEKVVTGFNDFDRLFDIYSSDINITKTFLKDYKIKNGISQITDVHIKMPVKPFVFENYKNNEQILCYESKGIILNPNDIYKIMLSLIKILNILYNNKIIDKPKILSGTSL